MKKINKHSLLAITLTLIVSVVLTIISLFVDVNLENIGNDFFDAFIVIISVVISAVICVNINIQITKKTTRGGIYTLFGFMILWIICAQISKGVDGTLGDIFEFLCIVCIVSAATVWFNYCVHTLFKNKKIRLACLLTSCIVGSALIICAMTKQRHNFFITFDGDKRILHIGYYLMMVYVYVEVLTSIAMSFYSVRKKEKRPYKYIIPATLVVIIIVYSTFNSLIDFKVRFFNDPSFFYTIFGSLLFYSITLLGINSNTGDYATVFDKNILPLAVYTKKDELLFQNNEYKKVDMSKDFVIYKVNGKIGNTYALLDMSPLREIESDLRKSLLESSKQNKNILNNANKYNYDMYKERISDFEEDFFKINKKLQVEVNKLPDKVNQQNYDSTLKNMNMILLYLKHVKSRAELFLSRVDNKLLSEEEFRKDFNEFISNINYESNIEFTINKYEDISQNDLFRLVDYIQRLMAKINVFDKTIEIVLFVENDIWLTIVYKDIIIDKYIFDNFCIAGVMVSVTSKNDNTLIEAKMERGDK